MRSQVDVTACQPQFAADIFPVEFDSPGGDSEKSRYFLVGLPVLDHIGDLNFAGGEV